MKKNYLLSALAVCACLLTACNKEIDTTQEKGAEENKEGVITYLRATGNENTSKGSIDGTTGDFSWNVGDQIAVWDNTNGVYKVSAELTAGDIAGDDATFAFMDLGTRADFAVSPASIVDAGHHTAGDFSITLPGTYSLADVLGEKSPVPMIAVNDGDFLHFKQLGALLRVTLNNLPPSTQSVTIDFNGNKVWGSFPFASTVTPGSSYIVTSAATGDDDGKDVIIINIGTGEHGWLDGQDVNIPVPTGTYTNITVKSWSGLNGTGTNTLTMTRPIKDAISGDWKPIRTSARKVTASLPAFSVANNVRVHIAKSNLQLTRLNTDKTWAQYQEAGELIWEFMPEPWSHPSYTFVSKTYDSVSEDYADETVIAHFKFGVTGYNYNEGIEQEEDYIYGKYYEPWSTVAGGHRDYGPKGALSLTEEDGFQYGDWGIKACVIDHATLNDGYGVSTAWRVPSGDEYLFLFGRTQERGQASVDVDEESDPRYIKRHHMWGMALVETADDVFERCMIVLPDHFVDPVGGFVGGNLDASEASCPNELSKEEWSLMEAAGAALYPRCGYRNQTTSIYKNAFNYCSNGGGWESETSGSPLRIAYGTTPANYDIYVDSSFSRNGGNAVRLIRELN